MDIIPVTQRNLFEEVILGNIKYYAGRVEGISFTADGGEYSLSTSAGETQLEVSFSDSMSIHDASLLYSLVRVVTCYANIREYGEGSEYGRKENLTYQEILRLNPDIQIQKADGTVSLSGNGGSFILPLDMSTEAQRLFRDLSLALQRRANPDVVISDGEMQTWVGLAKQAGYEASFVDLPDPGVQSLDWVDRKQIIVKSTEGKNEVVFRMKNVIDYNEGVVLCHKIDQEEPYVFVGKYTMCNIFPRHKVLFEFARAVESSLSEKITFLEG